jgi:hypothetical protein
MVTTRNVDDLRQLNFGARTLTRPITSEAIARELAHYDSDDARAVSDKIRSVAGVDLLAAEFVSLYEDVRARQVRVTPDEEFLATARSLDRVMEALYGEAKGRRSIVSRVAHRLVNSRWLSGAARLMDRVLAGR